MNLNKLEYFVAAADLLNFTRAAERCHISQTAMTQQIRSLEQEVGVPLFLRDSHHVELTAAGKVYLEEARTIMDLSEEAVRMARLVSEGEEGELTIGFIRGYGQSDLTHILRTFCRTYPNIRVKLIRNNMSALLDMLGNQECDLVFAVSPKVRTHPNLNYRYLRSYPIVAVLPQNHPLANRERLTYQELKHEKFIMMQPANRSRDQMEESLLIFERGGYLPDVAAVEGDPETLLLMISAEMGISLLPDYILGSFERNGMLRTVPMVKPDGSAEAYDFEMSWAENNQNPALRQFLELLRD